MQHTFFLISKKTTLHVQHTLTAAKQFSCFSSNEIGRHCYSFLALALFLLSKLMWTLKFSGKKDLFFFFKRPGGHVINERGAWNANISPQPFHTPPQTGWLLTPLPLPQSLYGQRSVVRWRRNKFSRMDRLPNFLNHGTPLKTPHERLHARLHTRKNKKQTNKKKQIGCKISFSTFFYGWTYIVLMVVQEVLTLTGLI